MIILGIDPGLSGGLAVVSSSDGLWLEPMPIKDPEGGLDIHELVRLITSWRGEIKAAYIERIYAVPKCGPHSMLVFGKSYGVVMGIMATLGIEIIEVVPKAWMKEMHQGCAGDNTKAKSAAAFSIIFEGVDARRSVRAKKNDMGLMEAALIAEYGRRQQTKLEEAHYEQVRISEGEGVSQF